MTTDPSERVEFIRHLYPHRRSALIRRMIRRSVAILRDERRAGCTCHLVSTGPVPVYCSIHDGDYSSFLVMSNCD